MRESPVTCVYKELLYTSDGTLVGALYYNVQTMTIPFTVSKVKVKLRTTLTEGQYFQVTYF